MAKLTNLALTQLLAQRNNELHSARTDNSVLQGQVDALKHQLAELQATKSQAPILPVRATMQACRQVAMHLGRSTRILDGKIQVFNPEARSWTNYGQVDSRG